MRKKNISFSQGTASVLLSRNEKSGEGERVRSIFQQIRQNTKDSLCPPHAYMWCLITKWWDTASAPSSSCCIISSATSFGTWREVSCEIHREERETAHWQPPSALHSGGEHCHGLILGRQSPSYDWKSGHADPLQWWKIFWVYRRCGFPCLQSPQSQGHVLPRCVPASSQAWTRHEEALGTRM